MKRLIAFALFIGLLLPHSVWAEPFGDWTHPGAQPYTGTVHEAFDRFRALAKAPEHQEPLRRLERRVEDFRQAGHAIGCQSSSIPEGFRFDAMHFGKKSIATGVVALPSYWDTKIPRDMTMCSVREGSHAYIAFIPTVCNNISLRIITVQGECVDFVVDCDNVCRAAREAQALYRRH